MEIRGGCSCGNIEIFWLANKPLQAPRACQCNYCVLKNASYVSEANSSFSATIHKPEFHYTVRHGTNTADFHECSSCNMLVFVSSDIGGDIYGVINSHCLHNVELDRAVVMVFSHESEKDRLTRRRQNWCHPVRIEFLSK